MVRIFFSLVGLLLLTFSAFSQSNLTLLDDQAPVLAQLDLGLAVNSLQEAMRWEPGVPAVRPAQKQRRTGEPSVEATPLSGCINPGDPECNGVCESGDSPTGPDCNGVCNSGDSSSGPDCNGVCDSGDSSSGPDCNGVCDASDSSSGPDCNGLCGASDSSSGPDCNGVCGAGESPSGPDCNGLCDPGDSPSGPDCNGLCDPGESSSSGDCNSFCNVGEQSSSVDCDGICDIEGDDFGSVDCTPLPAELIYFDAQVRSCSVTLHWETASELNVSHFVLERKTREGYQLVGQLPAKGSSSASAKYHFVDPSPGRENLYRLTTHDFDGTTEFSDLIAARLACEANAIRLSPNPVRNQLSISGIIADLETVRIRVFSMSTGALVVPPLARDSESVQLDFQSLPAGVYMLQVDQDGQISTRRFIKQ